jgi:hypothetical protein
MDTAILSGATAAITIAGGSGVPFAGFIVGQVVGAILQQLNISAQRRNEIQSWQHQRELLKTSPIIRDDVVARNGGAKRAYAGHSSFQEWLAWHRRWCPAAANWVKSGRKGSPVFQRGQDPVIVPITGLPTGDWFAAREFFGNSAKVDIFQSGALVRFKKDGTEIQAGCWEPSGVRCLHPNVAAANPKRFGYPKVSDRNELTFLCAAISIYDDSKPPVYVDRQGRRRSQLAYDIFSAKAYKDAKMLYEEVQKRAVSDAGAWGILPVLEEDLSVRFVDDKIYLKDGDIFGSHDRMGIRVGDIPSWVPLSKTTPRLAQSQLLRAWQVHGLTDFEDFKLAEMSSLHPADGVGMRDQALSSFSDADARQVLANSTVIAIAATRGKPELFNPAMAPIVAELNRRSIKLNEGDLDSAWKRLLSVDVIGTTQKYARQQATQQTKNVLGWGLALGAAALGIRSWRLRSRRGR